METQMKRQLGVGPLEVGDMNEVQIMVKRFGRIFGRFELILTGDWQG
jgi:hypothetical protein